MGKAVFATRKILDGTCIGEIEGEVIFDNSYTSRYAFDLENGAQLEPAAPFRFVNHSCEPNCAFDLIGINQADGEDDQRAKQDATATAPGRKLLIFAINDIECGEELTIDYNWPLRSPFDAIAKPHHAAVGSSVPKASIASKPPKMLRNRLSSAEAKTL